MRWSHSNATIFRQCPRRWYLKTRFKSARAKAPERREAWILANLRTVHAWRGSLLHQVIGSALVAGLNRGRVPELSVLLAVARQRFDLQAAFARAHRIREPGMTEAKAGAAFAAWLDLEYGDGVTDEMLEQAWADIELAATNLYKGFEPLREAIKRSTYRVAERFLQFHFAGATVLASPDLLLFFDDEPPLIVDWKIHTYAVGDAREQLATYALALATAKPHRDFPSTSAHAPTDVRLVEAQLLTSQAREYSVDEADLLALEDKITRSVFEMEAAMAGDTLPHPGTLPPARYGTTCRRCPFRRICWSNGDGNH